MVVVLIDSTHALRRDTSEIAHDDAHARQLFAVDPRFRFPQTGAVDRLATMENELVDRNYDRRLRQAGAFGQTAQQLGVGADARRAVDAHEYIQPGKNEYRGNTVVVHEIAHRFDLVVAGPVAERDGLVV